MSRILDYVLEPSVVYTNGSFLVKVKVQDDYKYKKLLVSENMKYTTATGTKYTLTNAVSTNNASILQLEGNTSQSGTPTPTTPIPIYTVEGDNEVVVCGKNRFNYNGEILENYINGSGMTYSVSNGEYTLNGSNTRTYIYIRYDTVLPAGTYFFSGCPSGGSTNGYSGLLQANGTNYFDFGSGVSFTLNAETTVKVYPIRVGGSKITVNNLKFKTQLEKGNTKTSFEPYIGNSYRVDFGGKNLLKIVKDSTTINGVTFTQNEDGSISVRGTATANASFISTTVQPIEPNRRMKLSGCPSGGSTSTYRLILRVRSDTTTNIVTVSNLGSGGNDGNVPAYSNAHYILGEIIVYSGQTVDLTFYPQVEYVNLSSDPATEYSPYASNPITLNKIGNYVDKLKRAEGKNLFDKDNMNKLNAYFESNNVITASNYNRIFYIECEPNTTYTIAQNPSTSPISNHLLQVATSSVLPEIGVECTSNHNIGGDTSYTMTTNADAKYLVFRIRSGDDIDSYLSTIMINYGSTALPYEPYGNNWYIEKNIGKVVLNGSEYWAVNSNWDTSYPNVLHIFTNNFSSTWKVGQSGFLSDRFKCATESGRNFNEEMINVHTTNASVYVFINFSRLNGVTSSSTTTEKVNAFKTWITANNVELYYILKNPTYEIIDNENLIQQLNAIQNIELIENLCYVDWVGEEKPKMKLQYPTNETLNAYITTEDNKLIRTDWGV